MNEILSFIFNLSPKWTLIINQRMDEKEDFIWHSSFIFHYKNEIWKEVTQWEMLTIINETPLTTVISNYPNKSPYPLKRHNICMGLFDLRFAHNLFRRKDAIAVITRLDHNNIRPFPFFIVWDSSLKTGICSFH